MRATTFRPIRQGALALAALLSMPGAALAAAGDAASQSPCPAEIAVIGGTYLNDAMLKSDALGESFTVETAAGTSPDIHCAMAGDTPFYYVHGHGQGRVVEAWSALYALGVKEAIGGATAGAINRAYKVNDFVIPDDFIDFNVARPRALPSAIYGPGEIVIPRYVPAVDPLIVDILKDETKKTMAAVPELADASIFDTGVLIQAAGGRFETAAEIRMFDMLGGDLVTMNVGTEMAYARMAGINYATLVIISNPAEGLGEWEFSSLGDVYKVINPASLEIVLAAVPRVAGLKGQPRVGDTQRIHPEMTSGE